MNLTLTLALERSSTMSKTVFKCDECGTVFEEKHETCPLACEDGTLTEIEVEPKVQALMQHLGIEDPEELEEGYPDWEAFEYGKQEYLVLTDSEADDRYDDWLNSYISDCILPEIPDQYQIYFDEDAWKRDAKLEGSRGGALASYDGEENEEQVEGEWYYIYRVN